MATLIAKTLKPDGTGDYTLIATWEAANCGATSQALTTEDEYCVLTCFNGDYSASGGPGGVNYTFEYVAFTGYTTDATRNIQITTDSTARHDGSFDSGFQMRKYSNYGTYPLTLADYSVVDGLEFQNTTGTIHYVAMVSMGLYALVTQCLFNDISTTQAGPKLLYGFRNSIVRNCLLKGPSTCNGITASSYVNIDVENVTGVGVDALISFAGINTGYACNIVNTVAYDCSSFYNETYALTVTATTGYNATDDNTAQDVPDGGTTNYTTDVVSGDFTDAGSDDYSLSSSSALIGLGTNLYDAADYAVDVAGNALPSTGDWSIGAFYRAAAAGGTRPQGPFNHPFMGPFAGPIA